MLIENSDSDPNIKSLVSQILAALHSIDAKTLTVSINKLDPIKKAPLLKIKIEMEAMMKNGQGVLTTEPRNTFANSDMSSHTPPFRMASERNSSSRASLYSPGATGLNHQNSIDNTSDKFKSSDGFRSSDGFKSELRGSRRLMQKKGSGMDYSSGPGSLISGRKATTIEHQSYTEKKMSGSNLRRSQNSGSGIGKFTLPVINPKNNNVLPPIAGTSGLGTYQPSAMSASKPTPGRRGVVGKSHREVPLSDSINRPPLYKKASETVREGSKFNEEPFGAPRYRPNFQTQSDFNSANKPFSSNESNINTRVTGSTIPQATFEISTTNYGGGAKKEKKKDVLDEEINKFNLR